MAAGWIPLSTIGGVQEVSQAVLAFLAEPEAFSSRTTPGPLTRIVPYIWENNRVWWWAPDTGESWAGHDRAPA